MMVINKTINLTFEHCGILLEANSDSGLVVFRVNEYVLDEEKSKPNHEIYQTGKVVEVYPDFEELKEIIKALQEIIPEEDKE